ncbi:hypothetical protein [Tsukamurella tyrosinosolvens]|uniref:hypothetical protein n=1 Tax=Tsukamurella tyrosinosolvens TaxID=57704 RepID=UPI003F49F924
MMTGFVVALYLLAAALQITGVVWIVRDLQTLTRNRAMLANGWKTIDDADSAAHRDIIADRAKDELFGDLAAHLRSHQVRIVSLEGKLEGFYQYDGANQAPSHSARMTIAVLGGGVVLAAAASVLSLTL